MNFKNIRFAVRDNTNIYKLELAKSLLYFTEFDFTYFWEQCIEAGKTARKTGRLPQNLVSNAKSIISKAHPYIESLINTDFSEIVTDCIIEYICLSDRITTDELWTRCISSKNMYENTIFKRISEYKTNRAINQWNNIVRLKEYATNKLAFIYDPDDTGAVFSSYTIRTRRDYFDLATSVAANELAYPCKQFPSVKLCNAASLPNSTFVVSKVSKAIYRRFADALGAAPEENLPETRDYTYSKDMLAMNAYGFVKGMTRPAEIDMKFAIEAILETPEEVYLVDSFKAIIDLEFDLMFKEGIAIRRCESCSRYFAVNTDSPFCDRVNSTGKTCREQHEELLAAIAAANPPEPQDEPVYENTPAYNYAEAVKPAMPSVPSWRLVPPPNKGMPVPTELEKRGQKLYNALYKRLGKGMDENEFKEWSQYLSHMKRNVKTGDATIEQLEDFLAYSDNLVEAVKAAGKSSKKSKLPTFNQQTPYAQTSFEDIENQKATVIKASDMPTKENALETFAAVDFADDKTTFAPPQEAEDTFEPIAEKIKPFKPESFASLADAMMFEHSDKHVEINPVMAQKPAEPKPVEIKEPTWQRMTREEAYAQQERDLSYTWDEDDEYSDEDE